MRLFRGEDWFLQLDSHHRFARGWDEIMIEQARLTASPKPVLSTYAPEFLPGEEGSLREAVTKVEFDRFTHEGILLVGSSVVPDPPPTPMRARFVCAHFLFAPGSFVTDVPYDPDLYFLGEEITLAVRAFTHGYDLFHPVRHVLWHEYTRAHRRKHWDDHTAASGVPTSWAQRDAASLEKIARLLSGRETGPYAPGTVRRFDDYEAYAGVNFELRRVQDYTARGLEPPNPSVAPGWAGRVRDHDVQMQFARSELWPGPVEDATRLQVSVHDRDGREIDRRDVMDSDLRQLCDGDQEELALRRSFASEAAPASWRVRLHSASRGWLTTVSRQIQHEPSIFISLASYRDPDLVPTIDDCLRRARDPERIRFGVCWQHGDDEELPAWLNGSQFRVTDVDWRDSRGQSWARAETMRLYDGEDWYLQLDSHHRFAQDWDAVLVDQARLTDSPRPVLSAPAPYVRGSAYAPDTLWWFEFTGFRSDGIPEFITAKIPDHLVTGAPIPTRSVCAHFLFAPGSYVADVPCDPDLYYSYIEITISIRAFTHGYDLFVPGRHVLWHEYAAVTRRRHWDDHTPEAHTDALWSDRYAASVAKIVQFLADPDVGPVGLGTVRRLDDYEAYAGISFRHRKLQDHTRLRMAPPNPPAPPDWPDRVHEHRIQVDLDLKRLSRQSTLDPTRWYLAANDSDGREIHRRDIRAEELDSLLAANPGRLKLSLEFESEAVPVSWTVIPHSASAGWLDRVTCAAEDDAAAQDERPRIADREHFHVS